MNIVFGALCPLPSEQIKGLDDKFDADAKAITRLYLRGFISESECRKARIRISKSIDKWVIEQNKSRKQNGKKESLSGN